MRFSFRNGFGYAAIESQTGSSGEDRVSKGAVKLRLFVMALVKAVADYYAQLTKSNNGTLLGHCELYQVLCELRAKKWNQLAMKKSSCVMNGAAFSREARILSGSK